MVILSKICSLLREPLLHFLLMGAGLFFLFGLTGNSSQNANHRITITQPDLNNLARAWLKRTGRPPTAQQREQQLELYIREQVLYREAMAMGLDQNDTIVRRRLAQKMRYLFYDLSSIPEPTDMELALFLSESSDIFTVPATITFSQIYLDPEHHDQTIDQDAKLLLTQLNANSTTVDSINLGDRSLLPYEITKERKTPIGNLFGIAFAEQVFSLTLGGWKGPITSEHGLHLVNIHLRTAAVVPPLVEIRGRVVRAWRAAKQDQANENFYQSLYHRYEIVLDDGIDLGGDSAEDDMARVN
jgi:hypothetical protein